MGRYKNMESQNTEYKRVWKDDYLKWICGFANAQGGTIYIGIDDNGKVCDLRDAKKLMEDIPNKVVNYMGIVVEVDLHKKDGLQYIGITIEPNNVPVSYRGKYYYRSGSTTQELNGAALQQFILKKMGRTWDDIANDHATINDLDRRAIDYFLRKGIKAGRINEDEMESSSQNVLENLNLVTPEGKLKNAAVLLFANNPGRFFTCVEFKIGRFGIDEADLITQDVIEGNIIQMTDRVIEILKTKYLASPIHYEGMQRIETLEVPENALREILYNSIAHKDYTGAPIQMRIWDDHIELWNEGALPDGITPETLLSKHSSHPRNKNVAYVFFKAGFIETWGRGYKKIRDGFEGAGLPMPTVESVEGGVCVTFPRNNPNSSQKGSQKGSQKSSQKSSQKTSDKILHMINENPRITTDRLAESIGISSRMVAKHLKSLQEQGILKRSGSRKDGLWKVVRNHNNTIGEESVQ